MHCEICDYSTLVWSDYSKAVKHSNLNRVKYYPSTQQWLCDDCIYQSNRMISQMIQEEIKAIINE